LFPKSKAIRGKFVFDPEHGGGRRRRDKHLPSQKQYTNTTDIIEYDENIVDFNTRLGLQDSCCSPERTTGNKGSSKNRDLSPTTPNPFEIAPEIKQKN